MVSKSTERGSSDSSVCSLPNTSLSSGSVMFKKKESEPDEVRRVSSKRSRCWKRKTIGCGNPRRG
jgi:hypothetical protein